MTQTIKELLKRQIKQTAVNFYWNIYGKMLKNPKLPENLDSILYVCKGNICRSPYAEYASTRLLKETPLQSTSLHSAGLIVPISQKSPANAVSAAEELGVDMRFHNARPLTDELVDRYDFILAMEAWQVKSMGRKYPKHSDKFFLLAMFDTAKHNSSEAFLNYNIEDPYGKPKERFRECFHRIDRCIEGLVQQYS